MAFTARTETYLNAASLSSPYDATVSKPTGTAEGDILFAIVCAYASGIGVDSVPSGWTWLDGNGSSNTDRYWVYYKIAGASEPSSYTWSLNATAKVRIVCSCYTGGDFNPSDPIDVVSSTDYRTSDAIVRAASMSVAAANSPLVFWASVYSTSSKTFTKPSVPTSDWVENDDAGHSDPDFYNEVCSMIWTGSGATGNMDATCSATLTTKHAFAIALNPAGGTTHTAAATLSGTGSLAGIARVTWAAKATLSGAGSLAGIGRLTKYGAATLSGAGSLAGIGCIFKYGAATLSGTGSLAAIARLITTGKATLSGAGSLAGVGRLTMTARATLSGEGSLSAAGTLAGVPLHASATLSGTGSLAASARLILAATATMAGTGTLSARAVYIVTAKATLSATGTLAAIGQAYHISPTLLAAQKALHRIPYVEAKVYDYEQGIKRLSWARLYEGEEPDNPHGIAFDGQGSMHRVRSNSEGELFHQKVTNPGPGSDYTQWTKIAPDCAGPCAIAAYGTKVYIFYRTGTNVLWKYYSHNYGQDWSNAELAAYPDALSLAACWKGAGDIVVCFAATLVKISAVILDTSDQDTDEYYLNHGLDTTYGIGATYQDGEFPIVLAGKDTDGDIVTYALYRTKLSDIYAFSALTMLISALDDVATAFKYPDCHVPDGAQGYETIQLTVVEDYSGVTAYTRPLLSHLVKDTSWSDATVTEPRPFVNLSSPYGVRLASTAAYWWMETPCGVWRAPRATSTSLDLTPYIRHLHQVITDKKAGSLTIILDNSKGYFASPGEGDLASLRFRSEVQLRLGYKTAQGNEALDSLTYWIDSWEYTSEPNRSLLTLHCVDLWGLASQWAARYSLRWNYTTFQPCTVWQVLYQLLGRLGIRLWNNPTTPKSSTLDNYYPVFLSRGGTAGETQLRRLLSFVTDALVPRRALCFAKNLLASESSSYEYDAAPGSHRILAGAYANRLTTTHTQVSGDTQDEPPVHVREAAFDWDLLALGIDNLRMQYDANLEETDQAQKRADALLRHETLGAMGDQITVPTNVDQELYDVITVTDVRCGIDQEKYRVLAILTDYDRRRAQYEQTLTLGAP